MLSVSDARSKHGASSTSPMPRGGEGEATMMDSLLSILPKGLFGLNSAMEAVADDSSLASSLMVLEENGRKRCREDDRVSGSRTPTLVSTRRHTDVRDSDPDEDLRPVKRFRGERKVVPIGAQVKEEKQKDAQPQSPLSLLPEDVTAQCLSFLGSAEDRFALQCTSKQFRRISNSEDMLKNVEVGGDKDTGMHGIIQEHDTLETASKALLPFAEAGNLEAIYMLGIIKSYCHQHVEGGISLLKTAASSDYVRASYALGLVLRDSQPEDATKYMKEAADAGYLPALQELLPAREMKAKYGEPNADELRRHLDPLCLNRLLSRHYVQSADLRDLNTSHCWNPLCGRWAFKANLTSNSTGGRPRRPLGFAFRRVGNPRHEESAVSDTSSNMEGTEAQTGRTSNRTPHLDFRVSRMKMCSRCCRAKYCSKLCQVYDWRSGRHKMECQFL